MTPADRGGARYAVHFDELAFARTFATPLPPGARSPASPAGGWSATAPASTNFGAVTPSIATARGSPTASRPTCLIRAGAGG